MPIADRIALYKKLEEKRGGRPLIVYVTSARTGAPGQMAADAIPEFLDQIENLPASKGVDLLVVSNGGDPTVAWRAISLLRERVENVAVLVPQAAFSAATLLAMGANEIIMHPNGNLGPVDPQITVVKPGVPPQQFGYVDLSAFLDFANQEVGLRDQEHLKAAFELFAKEVGAVPVGVAARAAKLSLAMGEKLLRLHMVGEENAQKARIIAEKLNKAYFHHGYPVSRKEARGIPLQVAPDNPEIEVLMWKIWQSIEIDLKVRQPFSPIQLVLADAGRAGKLLQTRLPKAPPGIPTQQLIQNVQVGAGAATPVADAVRQGIEAATLTIDPVAFDYTDAVMESHRIASQHMVKGHIVATRMLDLNIHLNVVQIESAWTRVATT